MNRGILKKIAKKIEEEQYYSLGLKWKNGGFTEVKVENIEYERVDGNLYRICGTITYGEEAGSVDDYSTTTNWETHVRITRNGFKRRFEWVKPK